GVRGVVDRECRRGRGSDREQQRGYAEKEAANGSHGGGRRRMPGTRAAVKTVREEGGCLQLRRRLRRRLSDYSLAVSWLRGGRVAGRGRRARGGGGRRARGRRRARRGGGGGRWPRGRRRAGRGRRRGARGGGGERVGRPVLERTDVAPAAGGLRAGYAALIRRGRRTVGTAGVDCRAAHDEGLRLGGTAVACERGDPGVGV